MKECAQIFGLTVMWRKIGVWNKQEIVPVFIITIQVLQRSVDLEQNLDPVDVILPKRMVRLYRKFVMDVEICRFLKITMLSGECSIKKARRSRPRA